VSPGRRLRSLVAAALVDSFGLSLGWTVFSLQVVHVHGLAALGACTAAMLVGVALSAPTAALLGARLDGRALLRVGTFALLLAGVPLPAVAVAVAATNVVAWTGYAGMRAEVAAADPRGAAMTWYMVAVAAIEAAGIATAALLPTGPGGTVAGGLLVAVVVLYGASLLPTWQVARDALVDRQHAGRGRPAAPRRAARRRRAGHAARLGPDPAGGRPGRQPARHQVGGRLGLGLRARQPAGTHLGGPVRAPGAAAVGHLAGVRRRHGRRLGGGTVAPRRAAGRAVPLRAVHERAGGRHGRPRGGGGRRPQGATAGSPPGSPRRRRCARSAAPPR
jgi:hypothetical protein